MLQLIQSDLPNATIVFSQADLGEEFIATDAPKNGMKIMEPTSMP